MQDKILDVEKLPVPEKRQVEQEVIDTNTVRSYKKQKTSTHWLNNLGKSSQSTTDLTEEPSLDQLFPSRSSSSEVNDKTEKVLFICDSESK